MAKGCRVALVLAGGNALGAYQAGVYQALHEHGIEPDWVVGASIGAVNGAVIAGNAAEQRLSRLTKLWRPAGARRDGSNGWDLVSDRWRCTGEALGTMLAGRPGVFAPLGTSLLGAGGAPALYDTHPLRGSLASLVDFNRLNDGPVRYTATAVDLDSGESAAFDTHERRLGRTTSGRAPPCRRRSRRFRSTATCSGTAACRPIFRSIRCSPQVRRRCSASPWTYCQRRRPARARSGRP